LHSEADSAPSDRNLSTWTLERLETFAASRRGQELEQVRVVAQSHACRPGEPRNIRLRWAKLSLDVNERRHSDGPWGRSRKLCQNFALRTWVIEHLGPGTDPDWNPEALARETLAALTLTPRRAGALCAGWRDLPLEQIGELRRHKNMTAHLGRLIGMLRSGPAKESLIAWTEVREHLP
jgi:hypothetical protein